MGGAPQLVEHSQIHTCARTRETWFAFRMGRLPMSPVSCPFCLPIQSICKGKTKKCMCQHRVNHTHLNPCVFVVQKAGGTVEYLCFTQQRTLLLCVFPSGSHLYLSRPISKLQCLAPPLNNRIRLRKHSQRVVQCKKREKKNTL